VADAEDVAAALRREARRRLLGESLPRIQACLAQLSDEELWWRPNAGSNSAGNLVLHLCGNLTQWVLAGLGGADDRRDRAAEFSERGPIPRAELLGRIERVVTEAVAVIERQGAGDLLRVRKVQGFDEDGLSIVLHVVEHASYHTGQLAWLVKARKGVDLGFYRGVDLERRS
jgi:uncharacterized damage-inducible protein DinB